MAVYALSFHADYQCRHSGRCCTADWDVPVEVPVYRSLLEALEGGRLRSPAGVLDPASGRARGFITDPPAPDGAAAILERTDAGDCVFFDRGSRLCVVHRDLGETFLPATCRHFPRIAVRDRRGTFITLSHFCPTAASMLFRDDRAVEIVESPPAFPPADYEGLAVGEDDWPPLLHSGVLMDPEGYAAWERHMVSRCADVFQAPESALATLARDAHLLRAWRPGTISLADAVRLLPLERVEGVSPASLDSSLGFCREASRAVPDELTPAPDEAGLDEAFRVLVAPRWTGFHPPLNRYLAAKAFASWTAYQGRGVLTIIRGLECALSLVRVEAARRCRDAGRPLDAELLVEAFRAADFVLNHLAAGDELARLWSVAEHG